MTATESRCVSDNGIVRSTATVALSAGDLFLLPDGRAAVYQGQRDAAIGDEVAGDPDPLKVWELPCGSAVTASAGDAAHWDNVAKTVLTASNANTFVTPALLEVVRAKTAGQTVIHVRLNAS